MMPPPHLVNPTAALLLWLLLLSSTPLIPTTAFHLTRPPRHLHPHRRCNSMAATFVPSTTNPSPKPDGGSTTTSNKVTIPPQILAPAGGPKEFLAALNAG